MLKSDKFLDQILWISGGVLSACQSWSPQSDAMALAG